MNIYDISAGIFGFMYIVGLFYENTSLVILSILMLAVGFYFLYTYNPFGSYVIMFGSGVLLGFFYAYHYKLICTK